MTVDNDDDDDDRINVGSSRRSTVTTTARRRRARRTTVRKVSNVLLLAIKTAIIVITTTMLLTATTTTTTKNVQPSPLSSSSPSSHAAVKVVAGFVAVAVDAFSASDPQSSRSASKILVTGASGKLGRIVLSKLENDVRYEPKALVRSEQSARTLLHTTTTNNNNNNQNKMNKKKDNQGGSRGGGGGDSGQEVIIDQNQQQQFAGTCPLEHILIADITSPTFVETTSQIAGLAATATGGSNGNGGSSSSSSSGIEAMIICTSAVPQIQKRSLIKMALKVPWNFVRGRRPLVDFRSLTFRWKNNGYPKIVDYEGQISQFKLAKALGIPHVVLVSSMGVTDPNNFLNSVGKNNKAKKKNNRKTNRKDDDEGNGDILIWKRRAERYLATESGIESYTIIHPGGLIDGPGRTTTTGTSHEDAEQELEEFVFGVDDNLYNQTGVIRQTRINREDLADLCIAALSVGKNRKMSFDCITRPVTTTTMTSSAAADNDRSSSNNNHNVDGGGREGRKIRPSGSSQKSVAEEALQQFFEESKTSDYAMR